jgi:hypothetical protein
VAYPGIFSAGWFTPGIFFGGRVQHIQLRTEGSENGDLGAVAPYSGVPLNLQMIENRILIRLLRMYIPRNWEFGSALEKLRNFGGNPKPPPPPLGTPLVCVHLLSGIGQKHGPGQLTRYSDLLRVGGSGDQVPVGGEIFCTCPDRPWGPPSFLYNGYLGGRKRPGRDADPLPLSSTEI